MLTLLVGGTVIACGGDDEEKPEDQVRRDLGAIEDAFNSGDAERLYEDFITADCRQGLDRDEAVENFERQTAEATLSIADPQRIEIDGSEATVRVSFEAAADGQVATATDSIGLLFEDDHWRFIDCFGA